MGSTGSLAKFFDRGRATLNTEARFPGFGSVINGCDPSRLDTTYLELNSNAGVRAFATTVCITEGFLATSEAIASVRTLARQSSVRIATAAEHLDGDGLALILATQNTSAVEGSLLLLDALVELGVRIVQLTYNEQNLVGAGCTERVDGGLTRFGLDVVRRLRELGVLIDLSHCGPMTVRDAVDAATGPLAFTHSNCSNLCPNPRNRTDEEIRSVAATGGVIGLNAFPTFVHPEAADVKTLARHAAHIATLASVDNVSLGLDFIYGRDRDWVASLSYSPAAYPSLDDWPASYAAGIEDITGLPNLAQALDAEGFSDTEIAQVFGGNLRRVLGETWR
jgi:membrane dipeptidase